MPSKKTTIMIVVIVVIVAISIGLAAYKLYGGTEKGITATGTVEVTKTDITSKVSGYLVELNILVGDPVTRGQLIAKIDRPDLKAQLLRDEAALAKSRAVLRDLEQGARSQELQQAAANVESARSLSIKAKSDYARYSRLFQEGAIPAQQLDYARSADEVASDALVAAQSQYSLLQAGTRPDTVEAQRMDVAQTAAALEITRTQIADTSVTSPLSGRVLSKNYERGEYVVAGAAIGTVGDMNDCWVRIYVSTAQLGQIRLGQAAKVKVDAYPDRTFPGVIEEISQSAEYTPRQSITQRERANLVYYVKVRIENSEQIMKPGLPADVVIE